MTDEDKITVVDDPTPGVIDILGYELEHKSPYWLSPEGKALAKKNTSKTNDSPDVLARRDAIRAKHRKAWLDRKRNSRA